MRENRLVYCGIAFAVLIIAIALVCILLVIAHAEHTPQLAWMRGYTSADGVGCCDKQDCRATPVRILRMYGEITMVEIAGVEVSLPAKSVHMSQETQSYWCAKTFQEPPSAATTRCVFVSVGG